MKLALWVTGHEIADRVAASVSGGIHDAVVLHTDHLNQFDNIRNYDAHIAYGILRGTGEVFHKCKEYGVPYFCIDKGYINPNHYDGFYRVSLNGTQYTGKPDLSLCDYDALENSNVSLDYYRMQKGSYALICPPTGFVCEFFGIDRDGWLKQQRSVAAMDYPVKIRYKDDTEPLADALKDAAKVITFNSSVGWKAIGLQLPVSSDENHSVVGSWIKHMPGFSFNSRRHLETFYSFLAGNQMTLDDMKNGKLLPLMEKLLAGAA